MWQSRIVASIYFQVKFYLQSLSSLLKLPINRDLGRDGSDIATNFAYLMNKNKTFARPSRAFTSANLRREMAISQVLKRMWSHKRKFEFPFLALTPHL